MRGSNVCECSIMKEPRIKRSHPLVGQTIFEYIPFTKHGECNGEQNNCGCCHLWVHGSDSEIDIILQTIELHSCML